MSIVNKTTPTWANIDNEGVLHNCGEAHTTVSSWDRFRRNTKVGHVAWRIKVCLHMHSYRTLIEPEKRERMSQDIVMTDELAAAISTIKRKRHHKDSIWHNQRCCFRQRSSYMHWCWAIDRTLCILSKKHTPIQRVAKACLIESVFHRGLLFKFLSHWPTNNV